MVWYILFIFFWSEQLHAVNNFRLTKIELIDDSDEVLVKGTILGQSLNKKETCYFFPKFLYKKSEHFSPLDHLNHFFNRSINEGSLGVEFENNLNTLSYEWLEDKVLKIRHDKEFSFDFTAKVRTLATNGDVFFSNYFPLELNHCNVDKNIDELINQDAIIDVNYDKLRFHHAIFPVQGMAKKDKTNRSFFLTKKKLVGSEMVGGLNVKFYLDPDTDLARVKEYFLTSLLMYQHLLGSFPSSTLSLVESEHFQLADQKGLIVINEPRQKLFKYLQYELLNWRSWVLMFMLGAQWFGAEIRTKNAEEWWILSGICDFLTYLLLSKQSKRYNIFNSYEKDFPYAILNYNQFQNIMISLLVKRRPLAYLVNDNHETAFHYKDQHPLQFFKFSAALKYLNKRYGFEFTKVVLRQVIKSFKNYNLSLSNLIEALKNEVGNKYRMKEYTQDLLSWLKSESWPDFSVSIDDMYKIENGKWLTKLNIENKGAFPLSTEIEVHDKSKNKFNLFTDRLSVQTGIQQLEIVTSSKVDHASIDPSVQIYEVDRFNNSSKYPSLNIFPGNTKTISEDNYTLFWMPFFSKIQGEGASIVLYFNLLKYLNSGLVGSVEYMPSEKRAMYHVRFERAMEQIGVKANIEIRQGFDNLRFSEIIWIKDPARKELLHWSVKGGMRYKEKMGDPKQSHPSLVFGANYSKQLKLVPCQIKAQFDHDFAKSNHHDSPFDYKRIEGEGVFSCETESKFGVYFLGFSGTLYDSHGALPESSFFEINGRKGASLRIDHPLERMNRRISAIKSELFMPFTSSLLKSLVLIPKNLKLSTFIDLGYTDRSKEEYMASGVSVMLPFGGDLVGVGPLVFTRLTLTGVLFEKFEGKINKKPGLLFKINGQF